MADLTKKDVTVDTSPGAGENQEAVTSRQDLREKFLGAISAYSEDMWCAGWLNGIEKIVRAERGIWLTMAVACGGWPLGYRAEDGWDPLTDDEMREYRFSHGQSKAKLFAVLSDDDLREECWRRGISL
jgi:hypothetical protein